ncbi:MAG: murein biosynthesis integral membrane protein MurJ [Acidobacteriia bacterium]|nr:murein biosynthesis integral membrane protein MurJ [Terriglobia bacterium]
MEDTQEQTQHHKLHILKHAGIITSITLLSRIFGYLRDQRITYLLGTLPSNDAYTVAYRIPNLLRRLVAEGAMTASFIPVFTQILKQESREKVWEFANKFFWTMALVLTGLAVFGIIFSPFFVDLVASGFRNTPSYDLTVHLNRIIFPYVFFIGLAALASAVLNTFHSFAVPASTPIALNLSIITFSFFAFRFKEPATALALGVVGGGILQLAIQIPQLRKHGMTFHLGISFRHPAIRKVARLMVPVFFGVGVAQLGLIIDTQFASYLFPGAQTSLYVADRVMELILGGYAISVATVILPLLSQQAASRQIDGMRQTLGFSLRIVAFIALPSTVGLAVLRRPIIEVLFQHGKFNAQSTAITVSPLMFFAVGLSAFALIKVVVPAFYSLHDTKTPVKIAACALGFNLISNFLVSRPSNVAGLMGHVFGFFAGVASALHIPTLQNGGLALSTSLAAYLNLIVLIYVFQKRHGSIFTHEVTLSFVKAAIASVAMGVVCWFVIRIPGWYYHQHFLKRLVTFILTLGLGTATYFALALLMKCTEMQEVWGIATRRSKPTTTTS